MRLLDVSSQLPWDRRNNHAAPEQGVADRNGGEGPVPSLVAIEEEPTLPDVADHPAGAQRGEEREGEVGGRGKGASGGGGGVGMLDWLEAPGGGVEAEEGRGVECVQAAEKSGGRDGRGGTWRTRRRRDRGRRVSGRGSGSLR